MKLPRAAEPTREGRRRARAESLDYAIVYLSRMPGWQEMLVPAATFTLEGSLRPGSPLQPRKLESVAGRASSLTMVPVAKKALQVPAPSLVPMATPFTVIVALATACPLDSQPRPAELSARC